MPVVSVVRREEAPSFVITPSVTKIRLREDPLLGGRDRDALRGVLALHE
jgi:hypothetical protein